MTNEVNGRPKLDVVEVDPASLPFEPDSEPAPMVVRELRSRHWIGGCGALNFGVKITEGEPGQFDGIPFEPHKMTCLITSHGHKITTWPVDAGIYEQWTADGDDDEG